MISRQVGYRAAFEVLRLRVLRQVVYRAAFPLDPVVSRTSI